MEDQYSDSFERAAGGMDYDDPIKERAQSFGAQLAEEGPAAILEEIENMVPPAVKEQIVSFPLTAVTIAVGIGIFLGMKKSDLILSAGTAMLATAATQNVNQVLDRMGGR